MMSSIRCLMANKASHKKSKTIFGKGFISENKFLVLGGIFLLTVVVLAGFLFTSSPGGDMAGRFTYKAQFEGASVEYLGAPTNSVFDEAEEVSLYLRAGSSLGMHAITFNINYDPTVLSLTNVKAYAGTLQDHQKFDDANSIPLLIKMDDVNKPHTFKNGDNMVRFDFKVVGKSGASNVVSITKLVVSTQKDNNQVTTFSQGDNKFEETINIVGACTDSDSGIESSVGGTCTDSVGSNDDGCDGNGKLEEWYCGIDNKCEKKVITCQSGCNKIDEGEEKEKFGVCGPGVKKQCTDDDGGLDPYKSGQVTSFYYGTKTVKKDECADTSNLNEVYCVDDMLRVAKVPCAEDMRCVEGTGKCLKPYCGDVGGGDDGPDFIASGLDIPPTEICYAGITALIEEGKFNCDNADWNLDGNVNAPDITFAELFNADLVELHNDCFEGGAMSICGNGEYEPGEECDDENTDNDDGCSSECKIEGESDDDKLTNIKKVHDVEDVAKLCDDGLILKVAGEECDDANKVDTDTCRNDCTLNVCGDGALLKGVEECDDGNKDDGDGCSSECKLGASCGDTILQGNSITLTEDLHVTGAGDNTCLTIGGKGGKQVSIDCAGHKIIGNGAGVGVLIDSANILGEGKGAIAKIIVKNCEISNFDTGIKMVGTKDQTFTRPTISFNTITDSVYGIYYNAKTQSDNQQITSNTIQDNKYGIYAETMADGTLYLEKNKIKNNEEYGVYFNWADGEYGGFTTNTVTGNKIGIKMESVNFDQTNFKANTICRNTETDVSCPGFSSFYKPETQINNVFTTIDGKCEKESKWPIKDTHYTECVGQYAFVTSEVYDGNLGGKAGANEKCNALASAEGASKVLANKKFRAWVSTTDEGEEGWMGHIQDDFQVKDEPYYRVDYVKIADDFQDVIGDKYLDVPISVTEKGVDLSKAENVELYVWTGTKFSGQHHPINCVDWSDNTEDAEARIGILTSNYVPWTSSYEKPQPTNCNSKHRLYCFEDDFKE